MVATECRIVVPWARRWRGGPPGWALRRRFTGFGTSRGTPRHWAAWHALFALALGKIVVTAITLERWRIGWGLHAIVVCRGSHRGRLRRADRAGFPGLHASPEAYALVGMGALIAGATDAPVTGLLLVFEMTDDYAIVLPLMLTVVVAHTIARRFEPDSLYSGWLRRAGESISHGADRDALAGVRVRDVYESAPRVIDEDAPIRSTAPPVARRTAVLSGHRFQWSPDRRHHRGRPRSARRRRRRCGLAHPRGGCGPTLGSDCPLGFSARRGQADGRPGCRRAPGCRAEDTKAGRADHTRPCHDGVRAPCGVQLFTGEFSGRRPSRRARYASYRTESLVYGLVRRRVVLCQKSV